MKPKPITHNILTSLLLGAMAVSGLSPRGFSQSASEEQQSGIQPDCYNCCDPVKPAATCGCQETTMVVFELAVPSPKGGEDIVNMASGSVQRAIADIAANGGVGGHRLNFTRYANSRFATGLQHFGDGHVWRHTYQWEMSDVSATQVDIAEPEGGSFRYTKSGSNWGPATAANQNALNQSGNHFYLTRVDGSFYHFEKLGSGTSGDPFYYQLQDFNDGHGQQYFCSYNAAKKLALVSEPGGRWLRVNYQDVTVDQSNFKTLATVNTPPPGATWSELTVSDTTPYRYLRYTSSRPGEVETYCNVAEVEFYDTTNTKIAGTVIGTNPPRNNNWANSFAKAQDGNTGTSFEYAYRHYGFTGLDLGAGNEKRVSKVRFYPPGNPARMWAGRFQGSNTAPVVKSVIASVEIGYGAPEVITNSVQYTYQSLPDNVLDTDWLVLQNATYADSTQATYTYQKLWPGLRPLVLTADDPRVAGKATKIRYEFWKNGFVHGNMYAERDFTSGAILAKFTGTSTNMGRKVTYANGTSTEYLVAGRASPDFDERRARAAGGFYLQQQRLFDQKHVGLVAQYDLHARLERPDQ